jgi:hypothetical protein
MMVAGRGLPSAAATTVPLMPAAAQAVARTNVKQHTRCQQCMRVPDSCKTARLCSIMEGLGGVRNAT